MESARIDYPHHRFVQPTHVICLGSGKLTVDVEEHKRGGNGCGGGNLIENVSNSYGPVVFVEQFLQYCIT
ncbi:unnamed protein product [Lactuca virosa]|uniref:Uncharacterized protein n=1 Tax=Lactuca virosa TaxID=75947 RepID=A0AAU9MYH5_9ASTR|nr:unnamed protein product [Lactuca virosa]